ncbi:MAG TPA: GNAT family N-acetyltransferase [Pyrinomonadaceae bacterium]|nr:GNAT family N-acetyltransferase [Pyrinomonadaceae bacterium]HMP65405.1 GNAT family N-acetyltransferase [Pyrinomonadaceae bacterium]
MEIRKATEKDAPLLIEFNQAMAFETEGKRLDPSVIGPGVRAVFGDVTKGFYLVAEVEKMIAGGLMVTLEWSDWRNGWFWWIQSVYVRQDFRGRGVYRRLYEHVKRLADEQGGVCGFRLYVERENERAMRVYEKLGMSRTDYEMYEEIKRPGRSD